MLVERGLIMGCRLLGRIFLVFLTLSVVITPNSQAQDAQDNIVEVRILGDANYPPYSYLDDKKQPRGIYVDILNKLFSQVQGYRVEIEMMPWKRALLRIERGQDFAVFPPYLKPDKRPYIDIYSLPILLEKVEVYCREEVLRAKPRPNWPDDYLGLAIGNNLGYLSPGPAFFEAVQAGTIEHSPAPNTNAGLIMLMRGRTDCYLNDGNAIRWNLNNRMEESPSEEAKISSIAKGTVASGQWGYIGYSATGNFPFKEDFINKVNQALTKMRESGEIAAIADTFLKSGK